MFVSDLQLLLEGFFAYADRFSANLISFRWRRESKFATLKRKKKGFVALKFAASVFYNGSFATLYFTVSSQLSCRPSNPKEKADHECY